MIIMTGASRNGASRNGASRNGALKNGASRNGVSVAQLSKRCPPNTEVMGHL